MSSTSPSRLRDKEKVPVTCSICGKIFTVSRATFHRNGENKYQWKCRRCVILSMSDEDKQKRSEAISASLAAKTPEEKQAMTEKRLETTSTPEFKEDMKRKKQNTWSKKSDEEMSEISKRASENTSRVWENMSENERERRMNARVEGFRNWFDNLTDEERTARGQEIVQRCINFWKEQSNEYRKSHGEKTKQWYDSLSDIERTEYHRLRLANSKTENKLHKRFESQFEDSHLSNSFFYIPEYPTCTNGISHVWDYGILNIDGSLAALVDLDGTYYHGDSKYDYDGIHSREEYDESRALSSPAEVKQFFIQEGNFVKCFEYLLKSIYLSYDKYIQNTFNEMRNTPFPYPSYNLTELLMAYKKLISMKASDKYHQDISLNTRLGDRLIQHFHHSIWHANVKGSISPYNAWYDDDLLMKCIQNRTIYQNHLNPNKILQGFNVSKIAPKVSVFSAGRAKMIISRYLSEFDTIFDPFSGFSGRMLGTISLGKRYIGQDISEIHIRESDEMIEFLHEHGYDIQATVIQQDVLSSTGKYPCLLTCPPYGDKESWNQVPVDTRSCDDWITECLSRFKCKRYVFVVDETTKYKDSIVDEIRNKSHFSKAMEFIIMIDRG